MTNKKKFHDDEYQFPQDGFADDLHAEEQSSSSEEEVQEQPLIAEEAVEPSGFAAVWANHKRVIVIIGVVAAVAITFAILRVVQKPAVAPVAPTPAPMVAAPVVQTVVDPQMVDQLASLKQDAMNNGTVVRQLQGQVQQLTNTLNQTRAAQQQLNQSLMVLVGQVQQLTAEVKVLAHPKPVAHKPVPKAAPAPVITFQLRAVVPGRAWIVGSDGQSHSVTVGDHIPQYGNVQSIDADAGIVITTSGKTIKF